MLKFVSRVSLEEILFTAFFGEIVALIHLIDLVPPPPIIPELVIRELQSQINFQELYLVHSQQQAASNNKNKKPTKKNQSSSLEVCATCKQVLVTGDLFSHLQSHSLENNFPKLGNQDDNNALSNANAWKK